MQNFVGEPSMPGRIDADEVNMWLERLRSQSEQDRVETASELSRVRIRLRDSVQARGSLKRAAPSDFPLSLQTDGLKLLMDSLGDPSPAVRREVAAALGEWGDSAAADSLYNLLVGRDQDADESVRRACARALGMIGGPVAVKGLSMAAEHDTSEEVRRDAINALVALAVHESQQRAPLIAPQGATRASSTPDHLQRMLSPEAKDVLATLKRISSADREKEHLRRKAEVGVSVLQE